MSVAVISPPQARPFCVQFAVAESAHACDWRWPELNKAVWQMFERKGSTHWEPTGPLNERGREAILSRFGLRHIEKELPLNVIVSMSPSALIAKRRALEQKHAFPHLDITGNRAGNNIAAELAG